MLRFWLAYITIAMYNMLGLPLAILQIHSSTNIVLLYTHTHTHTTSVTVLLEYFDCLLGPVTKILVPRKNRSPGLTLAAKSGPPLPISVPPAKSKTGNKYSWINALHLSWYLILRSEPANNRLLWFG